jgi:glycerol kinase
MVETTALGAAGLAGVAGGVWPDAASFLASRRFTTFKPGAGRSAAHEGLAGWDRAVRATLAWARDGG